MTLATWLEETGKKARQGMPFIGQFSFFYSLIFYLRLSVFLEQVRTKILYWLQQAETFLRSDLEKDYFFYSKTWGGKISPDQMIGFVNENVWPAMRQKTPFSITRDLRSRTTSTVYNWLKYFSQSRRLPAALRMCTQSTSDIFLAYKSTWTLLASLTTRINWLRTKMNILTRHATKKSHTKQLF